VQYPEDSALCQFVLRQGRVPVGALVACAEAQRDARARGEEVPRLWELLEARGLLSAEDLEHARRAAGAVRARRRRKRRVGSGRWRPGWGDPEDDGVAPGDRLGTYVIEEKIGCGSVGAVFSARCSKTRQKVALKVMAGERARKDKGAGRFLKEAQLLCSMRHPGLIRGIAFGQDAGRAYFVMELFNAPTLKHRLRTRGPLPAAEVAHIGRAVAATLGHLHADGIVHRDVKPANILVADSGETRLCDLGLARDLHLASDATASTDTLGTPRYMAPEQARLPRSAGPQADLYSLGVTLFHAAAGAPPFPEESGIVALGRHLFDEVPDVRTLRPDLPAELARAIWALTRKAPARRLRTADEAVQALRLAPVRDRRAA
jgi:serine/threonine-protein kinase